MDIVTPRRVSLWSFLKLAGSSFPKVKGLWGHLLTVGAVFGLPLALPFSPSLEQRVIFALVLALGFVVRAGYLLQRDKDKAALRLPIEVRGMFSDKLNALVKVTNIGSEVINLGAQVTELEGSSKGGRRVPWGLSGHSKEVNPRPKEDEHIYLGKVFDGQRGGATFRLQTVGGHPQAVNMENGEVTATVRISGPTTSRVFDVIIERTQGGVQTVVEEAEG